MSTSKRKMEQPRDEQTIYSVTDHHHGNTMINRQLSTKSQQIAADNQTKPGITRQVTKLEKKVGIFTGVSLIVGTMIGSGIFVSPSGLALGSGSVGLSLVLWLACGLLSTAGALCMAELGTLITESGGEYAYLKAAFGSVPAYMFSWMSTLLLKPAGCAIISLTCAEYMIAPAFDDGCGKPPQFNKKILAAIVMLIVTSINVFSVKMAARVQIVFTVAKLLAMVVIIVGGMVKIAQGHTSHLESGFTGSSGKVGPLAIGIYNGMWAYDGWNQLNYVTEELIDPHRNLPRAILIGLPLVTILYLLVNISYFSVMSINDLVVSPAVAVSWADHVMPKVSWAIPVAVALSTFGAVNGSLFTTGRLTYVAARDGHMLKLFSFIHVKKNTPMPSLVFTCILAILFIIPGDIGSLIDVFNFAVWLFYGMTMLSLIVMRFTKKKAHRPYKVPIIVPFIVMLASIFLVMAPIIDNPKVQFLYASLFIVGGLVFYFPFVYYKKRLPCMERFTVFFQLLMQVVPPTDDAED